MVSAQQVLDTAREQVRRVKDWQPIQWRREMNISRAERAISIGAGAVLAALGIRQRSIPGYISAGLGGLLVYRGVRGHCPAYQALGIDTSERGQARPEDYFERGVHVKQSYTIRRSPYELYQFWRNFENLPQFMSHLESVRVLDERRSHWVAKAPRLAGGQVEWDAEIINDEPASVIAWRSLDGADVPNTGSVRFVPAAADQGTEVHVTIEYLPPAGQVGRLLAKLFGEEPQQQIREDLRKFKQLMEAGEIATIQGQPRGNCAGGGEPHSGW